MSEKARDRRRHQRYYYKSLAVCHRPGEAGRGLHAQMLNVSVSGVQLLVRGAFGAGEPLRLELFNPRHELIAELAGTVIWADPEAPGVCRLGIAFEDTLSQEQVDALA